MKLRHLDLFSGIGGFSLGLEATGGFETVAFCDIEKYCLEILEKRYPGVPRYTNIKELNYDTIKTDGVFPIDIITGGYPCQPFSVAGRKKGEKDPRHLWPEMFRLVQELRPSWVIGENVSGHIKLGLDTVLKNLESEGYAARTFSISASSIGANHQRERVWIIANSERNGLTTSEKRGGFEKTISEQQKRENNTFNSEGASSIPFSSKNVANSRQHERGLEPSGNKEGIERGPLEKTKWSSAANQTPGSSEREKTMANTSSERTSRGESKREDAENVGQSSRRPWDGWWDIEPNVGRVANGVPKRVDRLKSLGNSLVPSIPYYIGLSILQTYEDELANTSK
jgi:DNA (cytosine-5)-methyltransferase 1